MSNSMLSDLARYFMVSTSLAKASFEKGTEIRRWIIDVKSAEKDYRYLLLREDHGRRLNATENLEIAKAELNLQSNLVNEIVPEFPFAASVYK